MLGSKRKRTKEKIVKRSILLVCGIVLLALIPVLYIAGIRIF